MKVIDNLCVENTRILFRNFKGEKTKYNKDGKRTFCVVLPNDIAQKAADEGWNVHILAPRDPEDKPVHYIQTEVTYEFYPPKVWLVTKNNKTLLDESTIGELDYADIRNVDVILRPYVWTMDDRTGIKAYVKTMYVTIEEDQFAQKYAEEEFPEE